MVRNNSKTPRTHCETAGQHYKTPRANSKGARRTSKTPGKNYKALRQSYKKEKEQVENYESDTEGLKLRLAQRCREAEKYDDGEKIYEQILENYKKATLSEAVLEMKYSYAEQLREQGNFPQAKEIAEDVWERRKKLDSLSENPKMMAAESKKNPRQVCSIYNSLSEFDDAEKEQGTVHHGLPKDAWKLENGDALCITLMNHKECEEAVLLQLGVWEERRQLEIPGRWGECTIRSALSRVSLLEAIVEDLSNTLSTHKGLEAEKESIRCHKIGCKNDIIEMLRHVWIMPRAPELRLQSLQVGQDLGRRLLAGEEYARILKDVWEAGTALYLEANQLTMSTGIKLVDALKLQESHQQYKRAASSCRRILDEAKPMSGENND